MPVLEKTEKHPNSGPVWYAIDVIAFAADHNRPVLCWYTHLLQKVDREMVVWKDNCWLRDPELGDDFGGHPRFLSFLHRSVPQQHRPCFAEAHWKGCHLLDHLLVWSPRACVSDGLASNSMRNCTRSKVDLIRSSVLDGLSMLGWGGLEGVYWLYCIDCIVIMPLLGSLNI